MAIAVKRRRDSPAYGQIHLLKFFLSWNIHPNNILLLKNVLYLTPEISFTTVVYKLFKKFQSMSTLIPRIIAHVRLFFWRNFQKKLLNKQ